MFDVVLPDGRKIQQDDLQESAAQEMLRRVYTSETQLPVRCGCSESQPRLVIAYRRKENRFDLRRAPRQDPELHKPGCRFNTHYEARGGSNKAGVWISMPHAHEHTLPDHKRLGELLFSWWGQLDLCSKEELKGDSIPWYEVRDNLIEVAEGMEVNGESLFKNLVLVKPTSPENLVDIELVEDEPVFVLGEVFNAFSTGGDGSLSIKLKGTNTLIWANGKRIEGIAPELIQAIKHPPKGDRVILMMTAILSNTGKSIQAYSLAGLVVDQQSFEVVTTFA